MRLINATTRDIDALDRSLPVVVPFAAIEQHGPHLPIGTDTFITDGILRRAEEHSSEPFLVLPVAAYGSSAHHMPFCGTVTLASRTFLDVARDLVASFVEHGFTRFVLFNGHGGNQAHLNVAVQECRLQYRQIRIVHATYWNCAAEAFASIRESSPGGMGHACEMETSVMLALHPDLVRMDLAEASPLRRRCDLDAADMLDSGSVGQFRFWPEMSTSGVLGDPTTASAAKGEQFLDAAARGLLTVLTELGDDRLG